MLKSVHAPVGLAHRFNQPVFGDQVSNRRVDNIIQPPLGTDGVVDCLKKFNRIDNLPAGKGVDPDIGFVQGGDLSGVTVPFQKIFREIGRILNKGQFKIQTGGLLGRADYFAMSVTASISSRVI